MRYFETIKCEDNKVFNLKYHEKRVANTIAMNLNLAEYIYPLSNELLRCKLIYDESGVLEVNYYPYAKKEIKTFKLIFDNKIEYSKKYLNREALDTLYEKKESCDEIIIIKDDFVTDTSIANLAIFDGTKWLTPKKPLLKGTIRQKLLLKREIFEANISFDMLKNSKKIALMNAMIGFDILEDYSFFL